MAQQYYGLITNVGLTKLAAAAAGGAPLTLSTMAFGDGGGAETAPTKTATALVNERYRAPVVEKYPHPTNASILYVEGTIPSGIGGWTLREAGIYDAAGDLIVIAKPPAMDVALISEGASTEGVVRLPLVFESLEAVQLLIDPTVVLATQGWVLDRLLSRPFITVESITTTAPPAAPVSHSLYVVPAGATGAWAGQTHKLAYYQGGWIFRDSPVGKRIACSDTGRSFRRTATGWERLWVEPEIETFLFASGLAAPHSADGRFARAMRSQRLNWVPVVGGSANALTITLDPAPASNADLIGVPLRLKIAATNTSSVVTLSANGLPPVTVSRPATALRVSDLEVGSIVEFVFDGTFFRTQTLPKFGITSGNNWIQFADGQIIQRGSVAASSSGATTISFPIAFTSTGYAVIVTDESSPPAPNQMSVFGTGNYALSGFQVFATRDFSAFLADSANFIAMGK